MLSPTDSNNVAELDTESRGDVGGKVLVPLLVTVCRHGLEHVNGPITRDTVIATRTVFGDIVEVVTSDDNRAGHFCRHNLASENTSTDGDVTSKGALLVCKPEHR